MAKFDYQAAKEAISQINAIVETCPEAVKEKCFELLFAAVFKTPSASTKLLEAAADEGAKKNREDEKPSEPERRDKKLPANVLAFARRHEVTTSELEKIFMLDHEPMLAVYNLPTGNTAKAQLYKVMMILLENGLLNNQLSAAYPELRETVREDGLYDGNFNKMLKRNHSFFKGAITDEAIKEDAVVELTGEGLKKLAEIVKELAQA